MSKILTLTNYQSSIIDPNPIETDDYLRSHGRRDATRNPIKDCVSKVKALNRINLSNGLLIKLKQSGNGFHFEKYNSAVTLGVGEYAITSETIVVIFSDSSINSLIVYPCEGDSIVIEIATDRCNDGGAGGDGTKVKVPTT